jgi:aspartyl/asparaginyl beta-hydroxylase (cupin superfamily)
MNSATSFDVAALAQAAVAALRGGDPRTARQGFERIVAAGQGDASVFYGLAHACHRLNDVPAALAALDRALETDPRNLSILGMKADLLSGAGDSSAAQFYRAMLCAAPPEGQMTPDARALLTHAQSMCDRYAGQFEQQLMAKLGKAGLQHNADNARFLRSLDLMLGKKQVYAQQPRLYYFPGLPAIEFFDKAAFPWLADLEQATAAIKAEVQALLQSGKGFEPYIKADPSRPQLNRGGMRGNRDWSAFYLWEDGKLNEENAARCPATMAALQHIPLPQVEGRSPSVLFSLLRPGAHIPAHTGIINTRLIGHLPLVVPGRCELRVGNETRVWEEGKAWIFDDTIEHEAWNHSEQTRVILLFEIWRPELSEQERHLVSSMLSAIDQLSGKRSDWDM